MAKKKKSSSATGSKSDEELVLSVDGEQSRSRSGRKKGSSRSRSKSRERKSKKASSSKPKRQPSSSKISVSDDANRLSDDPAQTKKKKGLFGALSKMRTKKDSKKTRDRRSSSHKRPEQAPSHTRPEDHATADADDDNNSYHHNDPPPPIGVIDASDDDELVSEIDEAAAEDLNHNQDYDTRGSDDIHDDDEPDDEDNNHRNHRQHANTNGNKSTAVSTPIQPVFVSVKPKPKDVCFDNPNHPGTQEWTHIIRQICWYTPKYADTEYSPPIYKAIKKQCKGRRFLIRQNPTSNDAWREATKPEIIEIFGECYNNERNKGSPDEIDSADDAASSSLNDSAKESEPSLSLRDLMVDQDNQRQSSSSRPPPPQSQPQPQQEQRKPSSSRKPSSPETAETGNISPVSISPTQSCEDLASPLLQSCIRHCQNANSLASPFLTDTAKIQKGRLVEEKLSRLTHILGKSPHIRQVNSTTANNNNNNNTQILQQQFKSLHETMQQMMYANISILLHSVQQIEADMQEYFQLLSSSSSSSASTPSLEALLQQLKQSVDMAADDDLDKRTSGHSKGRAKHTRSIPLSSDHLTPKVDVEDPSSNETNNLRRAAKQDPVGNKAALQESNHHSEILVQEQVLPTQPVEIVDEDITEYEDIEISESNHVNMNNGNDHDDDIDEDFLLQEDDVNEVGSLDNLMDEDAVMPEGFEGSYNMNEGLQLKLNSSDDLENSHMLELDPNKMEDDMSSVGRSTRGFDFGSQGFNYKDDDDDDDRYEHHNTATSEDDDEDFDEEMLEEDVVEYEGSDDEGSSSISSEDSSDGGNRRRGKTRSKDSASDEGMDTPPNPKVEQFFDRLQHFFEVRRKVQERAQLMDPSSKIRNLKPKLHSGGIEKGNGKFKKEYQQHDLEDRVVRSLDDLYEAAQQAHPELRKILDQLAIEVKGLSINSCVLAPLKPRDRAYEKAREDYSDRKPGPSESWLYDIVRCSVVCKSYKQMSDVNRWLGKKVHIVKSKNRFAKPAFNGYRDLLYHVSIPYQDELAHICEVQVHHKDMKALDEQFGLPKHLEFFRPAFANDRREEEDTLKDLKLLNKYGTMEGPLLAKVMRSKDCEQLNLFAGICRSKLDEFDRALEMYRRLLMMQEDSLGQEHEDVAVTYLNIGLVLGMMGETNESLLNLQKALAIQETVLGAEHLKVAESHREIGHMLSKKGDFSGALEEQRKALAIRQNLLGDDHFLVIDSLQDIGHAYRDQGDYKTAVLEYRKALKIQADVLGQQHTDVASTHAMIGEVLCLQGEYDSAMDEHRKALDIREAGMGKNHPMTAASHTDIGIVQFYKGDYEVAEWRHRKALRIREAILGKDHEECAMSYSNLAKVLCRKGQYQKALKEVHRGLTIRENTLSRDHPMTACSFIDLGNIHMAKGDYDDALYEFRRAVVIRESILGSQHPDTAVAYNALSSALSKKGDHKMAMVQSNKAVEILESILGKNHPKTATGYACLANALMAKGDRDQALAEHRKALAVRANVLSKDHPDTAMSCVSIGTLLLNKGDVVGATVAFGQALAIRNALYGDDHPETAVAQQNMGRVYVAKREYNDALEAMKSAVAIQEESFGKEHLMTANAYSLLGSVHSMMENFDAAAKEHEKAMKIRDATLGTEDTLTALSKEKLRSANDKSAETSLEPLAL